MWKRLSVLFVLLALGLSSVAAAWLPFFPTEEQQDLSSLTAAVQEKEGKILSQLEYIDSLESRLEVLSKDSMTLVKKAESLQTEVVFWKQKAEALQSSLETLSAKAETSSSLSELSEIDSQEKDKEIQDLETTSTRKPFVPLMGAGATWDPTSGQFGATVDVGVRLDKLSLLAGLEYSPSQWSLEIPSMDDLSFSAGFQAEF